MEDADCGRASSSRQSRQHSSGASNYDGHQPYNTPMSYQSDYSPDPQSRQPSYTAAAAAAYTSNVLYNPNQYGYNSTSSRHNHPPAAAIEVLASQFSATPQYYTTGNDSPVVGSVTPHHHQHNASQSQFSSPTSYSQYSPAAQRPPPLQYSNHTPEMQHQHIPPHSHPDSSVMDDQHHASDYSEHEEEARRNAAWQHYLDQLNAVFLSMNNGMLMDAGRGLLDVSRWLLLNVNDLGLAHDDSSQHENRIRHWNQFNTCWLSVLRKEKEMLQDYIATGHEPHLPQELMRMDFLENIGQEIVGLCDRIEQHGLVDYQMGVWEEEIIESLTECLDLWETINLQQHQASGP